MLMRVAMGMGGRRGSGALGCGILVGVAPRVMGARPRLMEDPAASAGGYELAHAPWSVRRRWSRYYRSPCVSSWPRGGSPRLIPRKSDIDASPHFNTTMCGFAGVVAWDDRYRVSRETLVRMSAAVAHRGPDGEGYHLNHEAEVTPERPQVALAFRRLAILDPDPRSNQPFTDGRHWLVFNGEIYNFRELRAELTSLHPSYTWRTSGDTEVLLRAYAVWGDKCVDRLNGMFAFAVWDDHEKKLFLVRDRMGQKPLYTAEVDGVVAFASEIGALRPLEWIDWHPSERGLLEYLRYGCTDSFHEGCDQQLPGFTRVS